jgi:hypothetical protein
MPLPRRRRGRRACAGLRRMWPIHARGITAYFGAAVQEGADLRSALDGIAAAAQSSGQS